MPEQLKKLVKTSKFVKSKPKAPATAADFGKSFQK